MAVTSAQATIAARMERVPLFSLHRKLVFVMGIGTFFDLFDVALGGLLGAILANLYHLNTFWTAAIIASGFFGMFVGAIALSVVSDYFGRRTLYLIDLLIYSLFSLATAFAPDVTWVIVFRFLAGIGLGATPALTDVYLSEMLPSRVRGRYTAWAYTFGLLGVPIAGLLSKVLVSTTFLMAGWRWLLVAGALGALFVWWMRRGLPESPRWFEIRQKTADAETAVLAIEQAAIRELHLTALPEPAQVVVEPPKRATLAESFRGIYAKRTIMLLIFQFFQTVGFYGFGSLAPIILTAKGFSVVNTLAYTAPIALGYPLGSWLSVPIVERMERKWLIIGTALLMALFGLIFGFATSVLVIIASGFLLTVASQVFSNSYHIYQAEIFPTRMRGTAVGIAYSLSRLSGGILPFVALPLLQTSGPVAVFTACAIILGIVSLDVGLLGPRTTGRTLEEVAH
ncbi:MFS transporter [Ktedonobacter racemifer]|uniref:Major facilitator superfamily MFS_1 n=1 Tax=Ktedonobacter racemifer DSM 44963 TaxID=485913 RepID=D6TG09_KTERA|nr:MFS transporter [Ktedonobacter racemifer]EFH88711.1 major facilitator superfamily MFS_1 [Ktedonobacter racemifer DSM 44963]